LTQLHGRYRRGDNSSYSDGETLERNIYESQKQLTLQNTTVCELTGMGYGRKGRAFYY
jgi:hypothetical protein